MEKYPKNFNSPYDGNGEDDEYEFVIPSQFKMGKEEIKRKLGFRDFPKRTIEEKRGLLGSEERVRALDAITTTTLPASKKEIKKGVVLEVAEQNLISPEVLRNNLLVYIGSGTDIEYALALGGEK
ncbi:MAG: hypothetical protein COV70_02140 [Parcubacteria group bacterium CG11_big_fil_rev_8_21_14_0_20_39_22]|nr:MAG: hypothetical protein COV70_02140 [Parcubacteria group bacterium CG11_big_fil_rev_8_21_14_0_20_39_22]